MRTVTARLPQELAQWVDKEFPHGFKQTFIEQCFTSLRTIMTTGKLPPPSEYARQASVEALTELAK